MKTYVNFTRFQIWLYYFASLIGLAPFSMGNNILRPVGALRKVYATILAILSSLWMYFVFFNHRNQEIEVTPMGQFDFIMVLILRGGNLWATLLVFAFRSNKMIDIIDQITVIRDELRQLGIKDNYKKNCKSFYRKIITTNCIILSFNLIVGSANYDHAHDHYSALAALYWIGIIMTNIHCHSAILIFVETMICIRKSFESLNNRLQGTFDANCHFRLFDEQPNASVLRMGRSRRITNQLAHRITTETENSQLSLEDVEQVGKIHAELQDLVESTTHFHTIPLIFAVARNFNGILSSCYAMYTYAFILGDDYESTEAIIPWIQRLVGRTTTGLLELILIAHVSTSVSKVGNATKVILHEVWNKYYPEELRDEFSKLSLHLLHNPVDVSVFGIFDLGYSHIYKIFCALVAYFIVMIQLDSWQPNPDTQVMSEEMGYSAQG